jgi:hypothetical protein
MPTGLKNFLIYTGIAIAITIFALMMEHDRNDKSPHNYATYEVDR